MIRCPYPKCNYEATGERDLDEHLLAVGDNDPDHQLARDEFKTQE